MYIWETLLKLFLAMVLGWLGVSVVGCAPDTEPIERAANKLVTTVVDPAVKEAMKDLKTRNAALQGQGSLINPGYEVDGYGIFGTGIVYKFTVRIIGASANLAGATQADQGPDLQSPVATTQPAVTGGGGDVDSGDNAGSGGNGPSG